MWHAGAAGRARSSGIAGCSIGSETTKLVPWPGSESTEIVPPLASTKPFAIASPRPEPVHGSRLGAGGPR